MSTCPHTGLSVPECSCVRCIEEQLQRFAPGRSVRRHAHDPLLLSEVRGHPPLQPPVFERLMRPVI